MFNLRFFLTVCKMTWIAHVTIMLTLTLSTVNDFVQAVNSNTTNDIEPNRVQRQKFKRSKVTPLKINPDESVSQMIKKLLQYYNNHDPPLLDQPTHVKIGIYVISFYSINEQTMDYSVSMYLRQKWTDPRLSYRGFRNKADVRLGEGIWDMIWVPDIFLRNEKSANFHQVTVENRMLKLQSNEGDIWYVTKITATLSCPMHLQKFPMDTQSCSMLFESFGYTMDTLHFEPLDEHSTDKTIEVSDDLQLPQFKIIDKQVINCSQVYTTGAYPCLEFRFSLRRDIGYFLIQVYVPSILIVILSWVSFWINVDASPARVSIGLLTVLTTTTMSSGARATLPRVSYIKAIDVWMIICLLFVFLSLIEYAVVNVMARKPARPAKQPRRPNSASRRDAELGTPLQPIGRRKVPKALSCFKRDGCMDGTGQVVDPTASSAAGSAPKATEKDGKYKARQVDKFSRKCFPLSFLFFNIVYWAFYSSGYSSHI